MRLNPWTLLLLLASLAGFAFAAFSTFDFMAHLDRQVHGVHCSFLPGISAADTSGTSGCHATMMSPYSSVLRSSVWGGIPVSLPGMAVFAFLAFWSVWLMFGDRDRDPRLGSFTFAASFVPVGASGAMGYIAFVSLGAACKLCIGIYIASAVVCLAAVGIWMGAARGVPLLRETHTSWLALALAFVVGVLFVGTPVATYAATAPDFSRYVGTCGVLPQRAEMEQVAVPLGGQGQRAEVLEVLDPLCPSCRAFENRFGAMPISKEVSRSILLFPLDNACNWMVDSAIHPGACAVSEAVLCAGEGADTVLEWAFGNQEKIMAAERSAAGSAANMVSAQFPMLKSCLGKPAVRSRLNLALRWAVKNQLQVLTPQVYVSGLRLCDEDTDIGLDYALPRLIERARTTPPAALMPRAEPPAKAPTRPAAPATPTKKAPTAPAPNDQEETKAPAPEPEESAIAPAEPAATAAPAASATPVAEEPKQPVAAPAAPTAAPVAPAPAKPEQPPAAPAAPASGDSQ